MEDGRMEDGRMEDGRMEDGRMEDGRMGSQSMQEHRHEWIPRSLRALRSLSFLVNQVFFANIFEFFQVVFPAFANFRFGFSGCDLLAQFARTGKFVKIFIL